MYRLAGYGFAEVINETFNILPPMIRDRVQYTHFLTGCNPNWVGLHMFSTDHDGPLGESRAYANTVHACYPLHTSDKSLTIVLPVLVVVSTLIHELGHMLDWHLGRKLIVAPICEYARFNRAEAFACAFKEWILPGNGKPHEAVLQLGMRLAY